jgi:hypothetical protein
LTVAPQKPAILSLLPYHMLLQAIMSLKEICVAKHNILSLQIVLQMTFSHVMNQLSIGTINQLTLNENNA